MNRQVSFRQRRVNRFFSRLFRRRRNSHLESRVFHAQKKFKNLLTLHQKIFLVLAIFAFGSLVGFTYFSGFFDVQKVSVARSSLDLPLEEIELSIRELAFGKNIFGIEKDLLARAVRELRPDIARVEVHKKYPREIAVEVFKFPIVAELRSNSESIFLNENGFRVFGDASDRDTLQLTLGEEIDFADPEKQVINPAHLDLIREAVFYFEALTDLKILNTKYFPISREAHLKNEKNFDVWLDLTQDFREQLNKLVAAADLLKISEKKYEYIDLRIRGKIFIKSK
ncbi:FtsQ-type POTRA domain-containing protein [Patescibacteria group bacterium]|nr:FtsQ-type POTRA domain-containing protein [Patescibacteria group bacterium]